MIDQIYKLLQTITNKELRGNVTPSEFNLIAKQVSFEIFREYFEDANRDKNKDNRGLANKNYANLPFNQRQRIDQFSVTASLVFDPSGLIGEPSSFFLPEDIYFIKDRGISHNGNVVDETESSDISFLSSSLAKPSMSFPVYERFASSIQIFPDTIVSGVTCRYLREPKDPKWTYRSVGGSELFDPSQSDFQDFELHTGEFTNIVIKMLSYFGINIRETEVTQYAEALKQKELIREEQ